MKTEIIEHTTGKLYHSFPNAENKKIAIWSEQEYGKVLIGTLDNTMYQAEANAGRLVKAWNEYDNLKEIESKAANIKARLNAFIEENDGLSDADLEIITDMYNSI